MGLFDTLHCEFPLPDGCTEREFQTKSLACKLNEAAHIDQLMNHLRAALRAPQTP